MVMKLRQPSYCWLKKNLKSGKQQSLRKRLQSFSRRMPKLLQLPRQLPRKRGLRKKRD
jgi:hypothetical protein